MPDKIYNVFIQYPKVPRRFSGTIMASSLPDAQQKAETFYQKLYANHEVKPEVIVKRPKPNKNPELYVNLW